MEMEFPPCHDDEGWEFSHYAVWIYFWTPSPDSTVTHVSKFNFKDRINLYSNTKATFKGFLAEQWFSSKQFSSIFSYFQFDKAPDSVYVCLYMWALPWHVRLTASGINKKSRFVRSDSSSLHYLSASLSALFVRSNRSSLYYWDTFTLLFQDPVIERESPIWWENTTCHQIFGALDTNVISLRAYHSTLKRIFWCDSIS